MKKQTQIRLEKKLAQIKKIMRLYQLSLDRSLKFRSMMNSFQDQRYEYKYYFEKMADAEVRCIELDEKISLLVSEYQLMKLQ
jgi:hypothetical protein